MLATNFLCASLGSPMLGTRRAKLAPHRLALFIAIWMCSPKLSFRSNCTPMYLMRLLHATSFSLSTIFRYLKDLLLSNQHCPPQIFIDSQLEDPDIFSGTSRGFSPFMRRTNHCFFKSSKISPPPPPPPPLRRQELKASRRISGYTAITSLWVSFCTPSIHGALLAFRLLPALFSSSRVKSSSH